MTYYYTVVVKTTEPNRPQIGWLWINPIISQAYIWIKNEWCPIAGGNTINSYVEGVYWRSQIVQEAEPSAINQVTGKIWIKESINQTFIYLDFWQPVTGG